MQLRFALYFWQEAFKHLHFFNFFFFLSSLSSNCDIAAAVPQDGGHGAPALLSAPWKRRGLTARAPGGAAGSTRGRLRGAAGCARPAPLRRPRHRRPCRGAAHGCPVKPRPAADTLKASPPPRPALLAQAPANESDAGSRGRGCQIWGNGENTGFGAQEWQTRALSPQLTSPAKGW